MPLACHCARPLADKAALAAPNIIRIDRPLMAQACADGAKVLVAFAEANTSELANNAEVASIVLAHAARGQGQRQAS